MNYDASDEARRLEWEKQQEEEKAVRARLTAIGRQRAIAARSQSFGYSDFIRDFDVENPSYWFGFEIRKDGVYVAIPDDNDVMPAKERAERAWHHEGDVTKPALGFPYGIDDLQAFVSAYNLAGVIPNDDIYWMIEGLSESEQGAAEQLTRFWWEMDYDILDLAQTKGDQLKAKGERPSLNKVANKVAEHINNKEKAKAGLGRTARHVSDTRLKKGPLKGWAYRP